MLTFARSVVEVTAAPGPSAVRCVNADDADLGTRFNADGTAQLAHARGTRLSRAYATIRHYEIVLQRAVIEGQFQMNADANAFQLLHALGTTPDELAATLQPFGGRYP